MNLNNTLCKVFEKDKNGDVTIETALITIGWWILFVICGLLALVLVVGYLYGVWHAYSGELFGGSSPIEIVNLACDMISVISIVITIYVVVVIMATAYEAIRHTKLAKCPVNKDNNNKPE